MLSAPGLSIPRSVRTLDTQKSSGGVNTNLFPSRKVGFVETDQAQLPTESLEIRPLLFQDITPFLESPQELVGGFFDAKSGYACSDDAKSSFIASWVWCTHEYHTGGA